jgi:membrane protease YdiL (CAAX protease family)
VSRLRATELRACLRTPEARAAIALVYTAVALTVLEYAFMPWIVEARLHGPRHAVSIRAGATWALASSLAYLVMPLGLALVLRVDRLRDLGWRTEGLARHVPAYLGLYLLVLPALWMAWRRPDFAQAYPFVREATATRGAFVRWELSYIPQFFALEAFFRGFLLFTLERAIGRLAVFVAVVPYCMIHWHKPPLEPFAAIAGGILLGLLALRSRSFLGGFLVHALIALTMDLASAHRHGLF